MKKLILAAMIVGLMAGPVFANESPVEKVVSTTVGGIKNVAGLVFQGAHVVFHATRKVSDVAIDIVHSGLQALEIPFSNGDGPTE